MLVREGDHVRRGQVLARLDTRRLEPQVAQAEAQVAAEDENVRASVAYAADVLPDGRAVDALHWELLRE